jgi:flagellar basal body-associated protein FliL
VLSLSAIGLWAIPVETGDSAMQLIKLLVTIVMLVLGVMFVFSARATSDMPDIVIDAQNRELTLVSRDAEGQIIGQEVHNIDDMNEITLRDRMFTARDASGEITVSLPLPDKATEKALRKALQYDS